MPPNDRILAALRVRHIARKWYYRGDHSPEGRAPTPYSVPAPYSVPTPYSVPARSSTGLSLTQHQRHEPDPSLNAEFLVKMPRIIMHGMGGKFHAIGNFTF